MLGADEGLASPGAHGGQAQRLPDRTDRLGRPGAPSAGGVRASIMAASRALQASICCPTKSWRCSVCSREHRCSSRQVPSRLAAIVSVLAWIARCRSDAGRCGSRSPATIARTIRSPVTPARSEITESRRTFVSVSAFCMGCMLRARFAIRRRTYARSGQTASPGRNEPRSRPTDGSGQIHWQSSTSLFRPEICFVFRGDTRGTSSPARSSTSYTGTQCTDVDSIATSSPPTPTTALPALGDPA